MPGAVNLSANDSTTGVSVPLTSKQTQSGDRGMTVINHERDGEGSKAILQTFEDYIFGADDTYETLTVSSETDGNWIDMSDVSPDARGITIVSENAAPNYSYAVKFGRKMSDADAATVATGSSITARSTFVAVPAGYTKFLTISITPTGTGTQLNFRAVLSGRGGA